MSEQRTGAQIMCEALIREGVEVMFGIPGGAIMPFYYAMWEYRDRLHHVLCRHEQGAGHAAEGYARSTGRVGVCIGTSGPGTTNLVTGVANAFRAESPMLLIGGGGPLKQYKMGALQDLPHVPMMTPISKFASTVMTTERCAEMMGHAFREMWNGAPGPGFAPTGSPAWRGRNRRQCSCSPLE